MHYFCSTIIAERVKNDHIIEVSPDSKVYIGRTSELLRELLPQQRIIVITDANIDRRYHPMLEKYESFIIGTGESIKTLHTVSNLYRRLIEAEADRSCFILAVGGGIVTDIAGFVASTYMRGIGFGFVSTTLLSQVDAGVGGKNGVNVDGFKNMVGTFTQPKFVICDTELLKTLPEREFRAGLAEVIKAAIIADAELFATLENTSPEELRSDNALLERIVEAAIKVKTDIVCRDEKEHGERRKLNLGHTLGHAIEKCSNQMNHGEAVAVGIAAMANSAVNMGVLAADDAERIINVLKRFGFALTPPVTVRRLTNAIAKDKKISGDMLNLVLPTGIGRCEVFKIPKAEIASLL